MTANHVVIEMNATLEALGNLPKKKGIERPIFDCEKSLRDCFPAPKFIIL